MIQQADTPGLDMPRASPHLELRLEAIRYAADKISLFSFARPDGGILPGCTPGAHIGLVLPNGMERQYSLVDAQDEPRAYTVGVKQDANSRGGSLFMHKDLRVGMILLVAAPRNNFALHVGDAPAVLIAGGIGITPIWCMAQALLTEGRDFSIHYACKRHDEAAFVREMEPTGRLHLHVSADKGRSLDLAAVIKAAPVDAHLYCCGPNAMLTAFEAAASGRPPDHVHVEHFSAGEAPDLSGGYIVELARSKKSFPVPPGSSILHVLRDAGYDVASSCEEGVCGACETAVLSGVPDHRDAVLSEAERAENKTMFICCSGCKGDRLVLDL